MNRITKKILFWTPRVLCIAFALFLSLFATDVFVPGRSIFDAIIAFLMHLIPVYIILAVLAVSWKFEWIGAAFYSGLGLFYIIWVWGKFPFVTYLGISGPLFLIGILFLINWIYRKEIKSN